MLVVSLTLFGQEAAHAKLLQDATGIGLAPEEETWRREHSVVQVGVYAGDHMPLEGWVGGQPAGIGVDYARLLASYAGLRLEFHPFTNWLEARHPTRPASDFDLFVAQRVLPLPPERFNFLQPYMTVGAMLVTRQNDQIVRQDSTFEGRRIAVERPLVLLNDEIHKSYPGAALVYANDGAQALDMVASNDADVYMGIGASRTRTLLQQRPRDDLRVIGTSVMPSWGISLATPKDREVLARVLHKAALRVTEDDLIQLRKRWGVDSTVDALPPATNPLNPDQNAWLHNLPELRVAYETDRYPYSFVDNGEFSGIAADYLRLLSDRLGLKLKLIPADDWAEVKRLFDTHQVDLIVAGSANDFSSQEMVFSQPYETFPGVIVTRVDGPPITGPSDLSRRVVAIREEQSMLSRAQPLLAETRLVPVGSNEAGLAMVASGKADAYIGTLPAIDSLIRNRYAAELRVIGPAGIDLDLALGLISSRAALLPYINRELNGVTAAQRQAIRARWLTADYYYGVPWAWVMLGTGAVAILFLLGGLAYRRLRRAMTDKELAEEKLADELSFQHAMLETLPYPVFVKDDHGRYLAVNQAYEELLHVSRVDLLGKTLLETPDIADASNEALHDTDLRVMESGCSDRTEVIRSAVTEEQPVHSDIVWRRPFVSAASHETRLLGTIVDVSDIRGAEARARASEQRLSDITEAMPAVVFRLRVKPGEHRTFTYVAGDSKALLDLQPEEILADEPELARRVHPDDRERLLKHVDHAANSFVPMPPMDFRLKVRDEWRWLRTEGGKARRLTDGTAEWSGYWIDTTQIHLQEEELMEAKARAESAVTAKGAFLAAMSHEIRTPMAGVVGLIELLSRTPVNPEQAGMIGMAQDSARLLLQILDDILDYSRIEANRIDIESMRFDPHQLMDSIAGLFCVGADSKQLKLYAVHDPRMARALIGDELRIRQILSNLMSNALKFTQEGHVLFRASLIESTDRIQLIRFSVSDTGIGISEDSLGRLFQPFTQAEQSTTRRFGGTGLGLSISKRLADMMGARLYLESRPGEGTEAILDIPLPVDDATTPALEFSGELACIGATSDLLFEELDHALRSLGFDVLRASDDDMPPADLYLREQEGGVVEQDKVMPSRVCVARTSSDIQGTPVQVGTNPVLWSSLASACRRVLLEGEGSAQNADAAVAVAPAIRILVAEDHPINQALVRHQLSALGYEHVVVSDGLEALEQLHANAFDILITDCHMPRMDGFELARQIRRQEKDGNHLPIIALTASALPEQVKGCLDAGMDDFLAKPVTLANLDAKLRSLADSIYQTDGLQAQLERLDGQASNLMAFYKDPAQLRAILAELLATCRTDLSKLEHALAEENEVKQRFWLHRIEGSLGVIGDREGNETCGPEASIDDRVKSIAVRMGNVEALLQKLTGASAAG